jgi:hypothetical protein
MPLETSLPPTTFNIFPPVTPLPPTSTPDSTHIPLATTPVPSQVDNISLNPASVLLNPTLSQTENVYPPTQLNHTPALLNTATLPQTENIPINPTPVPLNPTLSQTENVYINPAPQAETFSTPIVQQITPVVVTSEIRSDGESDKPERRIFFYKAY